MEKTIRNDPVRVLIVDDETNSRNRLIDLLTDLQTHYPTKIIGEAQNGIEALKKLESLEAEVVLCDINMPEMDGLEFARHSKYLPNPPHVIFVTAYDDFAVKAFEVHAIDYLVKPVRSARLLEALQRVEKAGFTTANPSDLPHQHRRYFSCSELGKILLVPVHKVRYIKADDKYVQAVTDERDYWLNETLGNIEKEFSEIFLRTHRSFLAARKFITGIEKNLLADAETPFCIRLSGVSMPIPISRRQWSTVKEYIKNLSSNV